MLKPTQKDFIRMFEFTRIPSFIAEVFLNGYEDLEICIFFDGEWWSSYMSSKSVEKATKEGFELYKSKEHIERFKESFHEYKTRAHARFEAIASGDSIDLKTFKEFLSLWEEMYHYYRRTEFFYVDGVFGSAEQTEEQKEMIEDFGRFKFEAREMLNEIWFAGRQWYMRLARLVSKEINVSVVDLGCMQIKEAERALSGEYFDIPDLAERKNLYFISNLGGRVTFEYGKEAAKIIKEFKGSEKETDLKGTIANKGIVKGVARILMFDGSKPESIATIISEVKQGDILVAETTSPEWMPACKKAGAIVTAQGGLLSHAAIVSRELNIPCVVGVSNALKVIKNGDVIEVDANNGVVKIISK